MRMPTTILASAVVNEIFAHVEALFPMALEVKILPLAVHAPEERTGDTAPYFAGMTELQPSGTAAADVGVDGCVSAHLNTNEV